MTSEGKNPGKTRWTELAVKREKASIKQELDRHTATSGKAGRLRYILDRIRDLEDDDAPGSRLRRYIYCVSALVHQERYGGLTPHQLEQLLTLADVILQVQEIKPTRSPLSFLYSDLHIMRSQIYRKNGMHLDAAWFQNMAMQVSGTNLTGGDGFQYLALANRTLRLGHTDIGLSMLQHSETQGLSDQLLQRNLLSRLRAQRLSGRIDEAEATEQRLMQNHQPAADLRQEIEWERMLRDLKTSQDPTPLINATRKGRSHYVASYIVEACLWCMAVKSIRWLERMPSLQQARRKKDIRPQKLGLFFDTALALQNCYDYERPLQFRLQSLGPLLFRSRELLTIDKELLVWGAAARWLLRTRSTYLASLPLREYRSRCVTLSGGQTDDVLGISHDMEELLARAPLPIAS